MEDQGKAGCFQANCRTCRWKSWTFDDASLAVKEASKHEGPNPGHIIEIDSVKC